MTAYTYTLPPPLVRVWRHPIRWTGQKLYLLLCAVVFAYVGVLIVVALYYIVFEPTATMTHAWHSLVPNATIRHTIRNVGEGLLGGLLAQQIIWNHYRRRTQRRMDQKRNLLDRVEIRLHIPNLKDGKDFSVGRLLVTPPLVLLYAVPGFVVGIAIAHALHGHQLFHIGSPFSANPTTAALQDKVKATWTMDWPKKLVGFFAAFVFGRRPAKAVFDDMQLLFVERRIGNQIPVKWYHPAPFKARFNELAASEKAQPARSVWLKRLVFGLAPIALGLAAFGWYVLGFIAKGG